MGQKPTTRPDNPSAVSRRAWSQTQARAILRAPLRGDVAQLGERRVRNAKVGGSIPPISTILPFSQFLVVSKKPVKRGFYCYLLASFTLSPTPTPLAHKRAWTPLRHPGRDCRGPDSKGGNCLLHVRNISDVSDDVPDATESSGSAHILVIWISAIPAGITAWRKRSPIPDSNHDSRRSAHRNSSSREIRKNGCSSTHRGEASSSATD